MPWVRREQLARRGRRTGPAGPQGPEGPPNPNAVNAQNADKLDNLDSTDFLRSDGKALDANNLDGIDSQGFVQGKGKIYGNRLVVPTSNPFPNSIVLAVPGFATVRAQNCQSGGANVALASFETAAGALDVWRDVGDVDPFASRAPNLVSWGSNFQATERTVWHLARGTGANTEAATIDVYTNVVGSECVYSATAQVWGR